MNPDYDDSKWNPAVVYGQVGDGPWNDLYERSIPQLYYSEERAFENSEVYAEYVDNYTTEEIKLEMKLPGNIQMNPVLELEAETDGLRINMETDGNQALCAYYFTTQGYQKWECYGWMSAQTLTITIPAGVKIKGLYYKHSGYDTQLEGSFTSDDPFMNQLWEECYNTLYICMRDNFMDCPDRERAQWWGDVTCQMNESFYSLDSNARLLYRKGVDQILGWIETEDTSSRVYNALRTVVPSNDEILELPHQELYGITGFWTYYLYTGEIDFLEQVFEPSVNYLKLWDMQENGLPAYRNGTWNWIDWGSNPDSTLIQHAWYYYAADCVLKMADELGIDNEDISLLEQRMESIKVAFDREYWKGSYYYNSTRNGLPDDRANAIAVLSGLASEDKYPDIIQILSKNETAENNYTKNSSPYFENFVQNAMFMMGYDDEALDRIKDRYGEFIDDEWTTLAEFFYDSGGMSGAASQNHAWSSSPMTYLSGYAAGIKPVTAGYETWQVLPQMGSLKTIETRVPAEIGNIDVSIHKTESSLTMSVTSPGKTAEIWVPLEEGQDAGQVSGAAASYLGEKTLFGQNYAVYSISEAGNYTFAAHETGVNKDILRKVLSYAEAQYSSPAFETVITDVQVTFTAALEAARLVNIDLQADQKTVDAAWQALMTEIHKLGFVQGDKTILNQLIEIADTFSAQIDNYTPVTAQPFTQALLSAKTVLEDGNAMQGDVSKAESALLNAMMNLRYKADRSVLTSVLAEASRIETAAYTVQSVTAFSAAYDEAITVNNNLDATQTEVNDAAQKLRNAINGLVGITAKTTGVEREGDANLTGGRGNAKTGENSPIAIALSLCMLAGAGFILSKKRK